MASTTFSGPVTSTNGFIGAQSGAVAASTLALTGITNGIVAHAGGGKASATALTNTVNRIATCATAADSVLLPAPTVAGQCVVVINSGAASAQVFGSGTDTIDGVATATGVAQANGTTAIYIALSTGTAAAWYQLLGA